MKTISNNGSLRYESNDCVSPDSLYKLKPFEDKFFLANGYA